ncbi:alanine racemase [Burkholderia sp. Bp9126]|nr:alanine racemase [Burkholderia sp. Bp9126]
MKDNKKPDAVRRTLVSLAISSGLVSSVAQAAPLLNAGARRIIAPNSWIEVNLGVFEKNLSNVRHVLTKGTKLCAVVKADAYGVGLATLMPSIIKANVTCIGIASTEEARLVRASGFKGQLLRVRAAFPDEIAAALPYDVEELVGNAELARSIGALAEQEKRVIKVHLALNASGMSRNGLDLETEKGKAEAMAILQVRGINTVGIMTHFAVAERKDVLHALEVFKQDCEWIFANTRLTRSQVMLHAANSFATLNLPESHLDMVRTGAALYGYIGSRPAFDHVVAFKSRVAAVNFYPRGNTVGYDRAFTLERDSLLANIPVGYSDGYRRAFTNKGSVLVRGERAPVVGKVSMNTLMVDVTDIAGVRSGDEVVLFGKQGSEEVTQAEVEEITGVLLADQYAVWGNSNPKIAVY